MFCSELSRFEIIYETFSSILGAPQGGSLTPPPPNLSSLGIFGATAQRFSNAPGSDRAAAAAAAFGGPQAALAAAAAAAAGLGIRNGNTGAGINPLGGGANMNLIGNPGNIFNSKYLIDIASEIQDKNLMFCLKNSTSPVLVFDNSDKNSFYVIMPMKI